MKVEGSLDWPELTPAKQQEDIGNPSKEAKETEESRKPFFRVLGDTKMIKMKVMIECVVNSIFKVPSTLSGYHQAQSVVILHLRSTKTRAGKSHDFVTSSFAKNSVVKIFSTHTKTEDLF